MQATFFQRICSLVLILALLLSSGSSGFAQSPAGNTTDSNATNSSGGNLAGNSSTNLDVANGDVLRAEIQRLNEELTRLEAQLPEKTKMETPLAEREAYVQKILDILARLEALEIRLVEGDSQTAGGGDGSGLALILKEIRYNKDIKNVAKADEEITNTAGFGWEQCAGDDCQKQVNETVGIQLEEYPRKILLGEPIQIKVKAVRRHVWKHGHNKGGFWHGYNYQPANVSVFLNPKRATAGKPVSLYVFAMGKKPLVIPQDAVQPVKPDGFGGWGDEDTLTLDLNLEYAGTNSKNSYAKGANYVVKKAQTSGGFSKNFYSDPSPYDANNRVEIVYSFLNGEPPLKANDGKEGLRIELAFHRPDQYGGNHIPENRKLILVYEFGGPDEEGLLASDYQMPDSLAQSIEDAMGSPRETASEDGTGDGSEDGEGNGGEAGTTVGSGDGTGSGPGSDSTALSPANPNVQAIMTEWLSVAEPPDNAKFGASLRYEKWGRVHGQTPTGTITVSGLPDEAAGYASHFEYLWSVKTRLDSVDHCTLDEYIDARLAQESMNRCANRYKPLVPKMVGTPGKAAKALLTQRKLKPVLKVGSPAPSQAKAMTVEKQDISPDSERDKNSPVTLWLYGPYVKTVTLKDYTGQKAALVKQTLENQGLKVSLKLGGEAPSADREATVSAQNPPAGTEIKEDTEVALTVYAPHVAKITVPDLAGMNPIDAENRLRQAGLTQASVKVGPPAQQERLSNKVMSTTPAAGTTVKTGTPVVITMYDVSAIVTMPNLVNMTLKEAWEKMLQVGLVPDPRVGKPAPIADLEKRVQGQYAKPGSKLKRGSRVTYLVYGKHIEVVTMPDLVNQRVQTAIQTLEKLGLKADIQQGRAAGSATQEGLIQGQYIRPGTKLRKGQSVRLLAFGPAPQTVQPKPKPEPASQTNVSSSSNPSGDVSGACGKGYTGAQNPVPFNLYFPAMANLSYGRLRIKNGKPNSRGPQSNGTFSGAFYAYYDGGSASETFHYYVDMDGRGVEFMERHAETTLMLHPYYTFLKSPSRNAYVYYMQIYKAKYPNASGDLRGMGCKILGQLEHYATAKNGAQKTTTISPSRAKSPAGFASGGLLPVDCSRRNCLGAPSNQSIYGLPGY